MSDENLTRYKYYLLELGGHIKSNAFDETKGLRTAFTKEDIAYYKGIKFAYYSVISLMQQQADAFDIPLKDLKLDDIDADRDLL